MRPRWMVGVSVRARGNGRGVADTDGRRGFPHHGAALLAGALALGGCIPNAVVPDTKVDVAARYRYGAPNGKLFDHAVDWWTQFRSPELTRFMEETEVGNFSIAVAIGQLEQADALARQSGAALLPTLTASNGVTQSGGGTGSAGTGLTTSSTSNNGAGTGTSAASSAITGTGTGTGLTSTTTGTSGTGGNSVTSLRATFAASYQVDFWGRNRATYKAAQENATASRWNRQTVQLTQLATTATTYFNVLAARERVAFARQDVTDSSRILKLIEDREKAGTATALDVAQQAALVANLRASVPPLQVIAEQNEIMLGILLGRTPQRVTVAGRSVLNSPVPRVAPGIPSEVLAQRPDVEFAESNLASAHANLVAARAAFFPTITLTAQGGFESTALRTLFSPASFFYSAAYSLAQPIFDGGLLRAQFDQEKGRQDELVADYKLAVVTAFSDVDRALTALRRFAEQEELTRESLAASRKALQLSEDRLKQGVLDVVTLLQTEQTLFTTQDTLVQVRLSRLTQAVALYQALGGAYAGKTRNGS